MDHEIDTAAAGSYAEALDEAAIRFCRAHPEEQWKISGVLVQTGLSLNATDGRRSLLQKVLPPVLGMADSIFEELETFRNSS